MKNYEQFQDIRFQYKRTASSNFYIHIIIESRVIVSVYEFESTVRAFSMPRFGASVLDGSRSVYLRNIISTYI